MNKNPLTNLTQRIESLDILRGFIILLMALDHTRDFFHADAFQFDPEDIHKSNLPLFFTRFITHLCAPLFILLSGIAIQRYEQNKTPRGVSHYLLKRGVWLIVLELTIIQFAWHFSVDFYHVSGLVIWVIGWSMIYMAVIIYLPKKVIVFFALALLLLHNLCDSVEITGAVFSKVMWSFLHVKDKIMIGDVFYVRILYPLIPALAIMMLGYSMGKWYTEAFDKQKRQHYLLYSGISLCLLFTLFRIFNVYGDVLLFETQQTTAQTIMSFLSITKYPFSLHYCFITLGIGFMLLYLFEVLKMRCLKILSVFGKASLFFYIIHLLFFHTIAGIAYLITNQIRGTSVIDPTSIGLKNYGYSLWTVYLIWMLGCTALYFICQKYAVYKNSTKNTLTTLI